MSLNEFLKNEFKKCYVINLKRRPDRYAEFCKRIPFNINQVIRFDAIDGDDLKHIKANINRYVVGCHLSHKTLLKMIVDDVDIKDSDLFIIFEDDVFFTDDFSLKIQENIKILKGLKDIDNSLFMLYAGGRFTPSFRPTTQGKYWTKIDGNLYLKNTSLSSMIPNVDKERTGHITIMNKLTAKAILEGIKDIPESEAMDEVYNKIHKLVKDMKIYEIFPHLCYSPQNYKSDIQIGMERKPRYGLKISS